MTNKEIANTFRDLAAMMELHEENKFKIRSYSNAYINLRKLGTPILEMEAAEWPTIKGIGKSIAGKLGEIKETGTLSDFDKYRALTPEGIQELLQLKGFGPKKIRVIWKELEVESVGELLYACNENRLIELKGFGAKTQEDLRQKLVYFQQSKGKFHYASIEAAAEKLLAKLKADLPNASISLVGQIRRLNPVIDAIEILVATEMDIKTIFQEEQLILVEQSEKQLRCKIAEEFPVIIYMCEKSEFGSKQFRYSASKEFMDAFLAEAKATDFKGIATEEAVFEKANIPFILPELRESKAFITKGKQGGIPVLIDAKDIKGVIHTHTTYSDGIHSLREMALESKRLGYSYIGITDHSKSAFYAGGLKEEELQQQFAEIDELNAEMTDFRIFKGIESDILNSGELDYEEGILKQFDFIIASVHSNLKMDEAKATQRLLAAIENPYTTILGHPTGRLLLSRKGYPIDHKKVIDACAANNVILELNANPHRLDIDWRWIPYALEKGVKIAINPDAHSMSGIKHIRYGVLAARKGGLSKEMCMNSLTATEFAAMLGK